MNKKMWYVANWKMQLSYDQAIAYVTVNKSGFEQLAQNHSMILCPSFDALSSIAPIVKNSAIALGAQNCSAHKIGPFTGQVSAVSLAQIGCSYCIIGHSEQRALGETDARIAQKTTLLFSQKIIPILCIGETKDEYDQKKVFHVLEEQLKAIWPIFNNQTIFIAYEPVWAIGTSMVPETDYIEKTLEWIKNKASQLTPAATVNLLYGGSVNAQNALNIAQISTCNGFLIGGASLDFQKFEKIVSLKV